MGVARRDDDDMVTTVVPSEASSNSDSLGEYYDACSRLGVTAFTTTVSTPTET
jgi:hypothetical protein